MKHPIIHIGVGNVGREAAMQIAQYGENLSYAAMFDRSGGVFSESGLTTEAIDSFPQDVSADSTPEVVVEKLARPSILVDTTAADTTLSSMKKVLASGGAVVMSNKKPITGNQADWDELHELGDGDRLLYETTVGAGLPVIQTLKSLLATGDKILEIQGCFSGTLGFIFSELEAGTSFSAAVASAKEQGFTEPDPRDDLSGMDVARKVLILSRVLGEKIEIDDVKIERLYSDELVTLSKDEFMEQVASLDASYAQKAAEAKNDGKVLRYVATVRPDIHSVELLAVPADSDIGGLRGPDNIVVIRTERYDTNPLVIKGPGAGVAVTAAGVFADCIFAAQALERQAAK